MKRVVSPGVFAALVAVFFLPFISVSCNTGALQDGFGDLGEGLGIPEDAETEIPAGGFEVSSSGFDIIRGSTPEPEPFGELGEEIGDIEESFGGDLEEAAGTEDGSFPGRIFAMFAFAAAILGMGLSPLSGRIGSGAALVLGALSALFLFLLRSSIAGELGVAALFGFSVSYEYGWWLAVALSFGAAGLGLWGLIGARTSAPALPAPPPPAERAPPPPQIPPPPD